MPVTRVFLCLRFNTDFLVVYSAVLVAVQFIFLAPVKNSALNEWGYKTPTEN